MALFVGEFDQLIDEKRRLAIPSALREQINPDVDGKEFFLVLGPDRHLWLYPDKYYRSLTARLKRSPLPTRSGQSLGLFFAMARYVKPDSQGRVVLPEKSMERAEVSQELTLVGQDDHIELWSRAKWNEHLEKMLPTYGEALLDAGERLSRELLGETDV